MIYLKMGLAALNAAGWVTKLVAVVLLLGSLATAYGVWHHRVYQSGVNDTIAGIAREDARLINRALEARGKWKECRDSNRNWDQSTGRCL